MRLKDPIIVELTQYFGFLECHVNALTVSFPVHIYTTDFQYNTGSCHLQNFSDKLAVVGCTSEGQKEEYRALVDNVVEWTGQNHLRLNINKTREMVIDFRRKSRSAFQPLYVFGKDVEVVEDYKYLGVTINHRLDW